MKQFPRSHFILSLSIVVIVALTLYLLGGCTKKDETTRNHMTGTRKNPIKYRLKWLYNASFAGDIWAREKGVFRAHGLTVKLLEGGAEQDAIKDLELGRVQFGVASADQVIRAVSEGADVLVLAQIFQKNPLQWIYNQKRLTINRPQDLKGLTIGITYGGNDESIMRALLKAYGIPTDSLTLYAVHYDYNPFWKGEVDLWPVYRNTEGIILQKKMQKANWKAGFFIPDRFGIRFVANSLITSGRIYREQPALVKEFTQAVIEGWQAAMDPANLATAARIVHRFDTDTPLAIIKQQLTSTRTFVTPEGKWPMGRIDRAAWAQTLGIMSSQGLIKREIKLAPLLAGPPP